MKRFTDAPSLYMTKWTWGYPWWKNSFWDFWTGHELYPLAQGYLCRGLAIHLSMPCRLISEIDLMSFTPCPRVSPQRFGHWSVVALSARKLDSSCRASAAGAIWFCPGYNIRCMRRIHQHALSIYDKLHLRLHRVGKFSLKSLGLGKNLKKMRIFYFQNSFRKLYQCFLYAIAFVPGWFLSF